MKCFLCISHFLEEISSLSHSIFFLYFFALITEEGFLISPCYSLELCIQMSLSFLSLICKPSPDSHFVFLYFFSLWMVLIPVSRTMSWISVHSSLGTLSDLIPWIYLSLPPYNRKGFDLGHTWMDTSNLYFSPFSLASLLFSAICKTSSDNHSAVLCFFFLGIILIPASSTMAWTSVHSSSCTPSNLFPWIYFSLPLYNCKGFCLGQTWMV